MGVVQVKQGQFIQVVGTLDLRSGEAQILYVNPASSAAVTGPGEGDRRATLEMLSATGEVIDSVHPALQISSCRGDDADDVALIQEYLPAHPGAASIRIKVDNRVLAEFSAGALREHELEVMRAEPVDTGSTHAGPKVVLGRGRQAQPNVTYSVQARAKNARTWSTLTVGRQLPEVVLDANQFPGQSQVEVRVLETNGFTEREIAREIYKLKN